LLPVNDLGLPDMLPAHFSCKVSRTVVSPSKVYNLLGSMSPSLFLFWRIQFRLIGLYYSSTQNLINCFSCGGSAELRVICIGAWRVLKGSWARFDWSEVGGDVILFDDRRYVENGFGNIEYLHRCIGMVVEIQHHFFHICKSPWMPGFIYLFKLLIFCLQDFISLVVQAVGRDGCR
jgi:hypothetical protein